MYLHGDAAFKSSFGRVMALAGAALTDTWETAAPPPPGAAATAAAAGTAGVLTATADLIMVDAEASAAATGAGTAGGGGGGARNGPPGTPNPGNQALLSGGRGTGDAALRRAARALRIPVVDKDWAVAVVLRGALPEGFVAQLVARGAPGAALHRKSSGAQQQNGEGQEEMEAGGRVSAMGTEVQAKEQQQQQGGKRRRSMGSGAGVAAGGVVEGGGGGSPLRQRQRQPDPPAAGGGTAKARRPAPSPHPPGGPEAPSLHPQAGPQAAEEDDCLLVDADGGTGVAGPSGCGPGARTRSPLPVPTSHKQHRTGTTPPLQRQEPPPRHERSPHLPPPHAASQALALAPPPAPLASPAPAPGPAPSYTFVRWLQPLQPAGGGAAGGGGCLSACPLFTGYVRRAAAGLSAGGQEQAQHGSRQHQRQEQGQQGGAGEEVRVGDVVEVAPLPGQSAARPPVVLVEELWEEAGADGAAARFASGRRLLRSEVRGVGRYRDGGGTRVIGGVIHWAGLRLSRLWGTGMKNERQDGGEAHSRVLAERNDTTACSAAC